MRHSYLGRAGWDPLAEMRRMQAEVNRLFTGLDERLATGAASIFPTMSVSAGSAAWPPVSIWLGEDSVVVTAALPGMTEQGLDLSIREDRLTIQGERPDSPTLAAKAGVRDEKAETEWHRRERGQGRFSRAVDLPFRIDPDRVEARFSNGVLAVELHRPAADRPRRIPIATG